MLKKEEKIKLINRYGKTEKDTGSIEVQIAILTEQIKKLTDHLKTHPKDNNSRRGLLKMVSKRKKFLNSLQKESVRRYNKIIKELNLK
ncbi:MAG TPA: 30S ribosomal protein S15 [Candidatus Paceibacterota bacterium]|jgi:small subunit ribosomal protein S15|nr:30S ribosomal protein S15 [Parcubacteria group bacterium]HOM33033.1 30S ribosomal protein S15 [Candidatus Paceibacterota bacterium]HPC37441.1 30S ribosomal protein S15 [Candidatus Paceibacterota bacterium]HRU36030.1 30S ribosomal protein S15 [Candidatus Paceibacterota bacterium]